MCTVVLLRRPGHDWPLIVGANRDEAVDRPWRAPGRHWPDRPETVAGLDEEAGGSWLGLNDHGLVASILNRRHTLGRDPHKRSRGELVLEALDHADAATAAAALGQIDAYAYRAFNMVIADNRDAFWLKALSDDGDGRVAVSPIPPGVSILTAWDRNDTVASERTRYFLPHFEAAPPPDPEAGDWHAWQELLASRARAVGVSDPNGSMHVVTGYGFGTVSSSLIALPGPADPPRAPIWRFAETWPDRDSWFDVPI